MANIIGQFMSKRLKRKMIFFPKKQTNLNQFMKGICGENSTWVKHIVNHVKTIIFTKCPLP